MKTERTMSVSGWFVAFLVVGAVAGCDVIDVDELAAPREAAGGGGAVGGEVTFSGTIQPILLEFCSGCHNASSATGGVDATSFAGLMAKADIVVPGDPDASIILEMLEGGMMPPVGKPRPTAEQVAAIRAWITAGALND